MAKKTASDSHRTLGEDRAAELVKEGRIKGERRSKRQRFRTFAESYLNAADSTTFLNIYRSALTAGYSESYSSSQAFKLLDNIGVQREIEAIRSAARGNPNIASSDEVLEALTTQVRTLANRLFHPETKQLISPADMTDAQAQALAGYKVTQRVIPGSGEEGQPEVETKYEVKLVDRLRALEMLGRWHGIWEKDNRQKAPTTPVALVAFPTGVLSLEEWQAQAIAILDAQDKAKAIP